MQITRSDHNLTFQFSKAEWRIRDGQACHEFVEELKALIAKEYRDYDSTTNTWTINASFAHVVDGLREKYFVDKNQPELF